MLVTKNDTADYQINNSRPGAILREESADIGFGEALEREYASFKALNMFTSRANNLYDEYDREIDRIRMSGAPAPRNPLDFAPFDEGDDRIPEKRIAKFHEEIAVLRGGGYEPRSFEQIEAGSAERVRTIKAKAQEGHDTTGAFWARLGAAAFGSIQDPINITVTAVTLPFGGWGAAGLGTLRGSAIAVGKTALFEGAVNMAAESAIQPFVTAYHRDVGLPYSMEEALTSVAGAGVGGAVLGGAMRAGGIAIGEALFRRSLNAGETPGTALADTLAALDPNARADILSRFPPSLARALEPDTQPSARGILDALDELQASGHVVDSRVAGARAVLDDAVWLSESNPFPRSGASDLLHERTITTAVRALDTGDFQDFARALEMRGPSLQEGAGTLGRSVDQEAPSPEITPIREGGDLPPRAIASATDSVTELSRLEDDALFSDANRILGERGDIELWTSFENIDGTTGTQAIGAREAFSRADADLRTAQALAVCPLKG